jgi:hypothetical protein
VVLKYRNVVLKSHLLAGGILSGVRTSLGAKRCTVKARMSSVPVRSKTARYSVSDPGLI